MTNLTTTIPWTPLTRRALALVAFVLAWALYLAHFVLPVAAAAPVGVSAGPPMTGREALAACFLSPALWTAALGHLLFWAGSLLLLAERWDWAMLGGLLALTSGGILALILWPPSVGVFCQLLAMATLFLAGAAGTWLQETTG